MMNREPIVFVFNSPLSSGCDYVTQTMRIVARRFPVYGIALGDIVSFPRWLFGNDWWIVRRIHGATVVRPISLFPGIRYRWVRTATYVSIGGLLRIYLWLKFGGSKKIFWFFEPFHIPPILSIFSGYESIYDCVDYYSGFNTQAKRDHDIVIRKASYVFANSESLTKKLKQARSDVIRVPLGFAEELFRGIRVSPIPPKKKPFVVGYIGSISDRLDFPLLEETIKKLPSIQFLFVGPLEPDVFGRPDDAINQFNKVLTYKNVRWIHGVPKKAIPSLLATIDVGLIPYRIDNAFNRLSFPMKVMEYFALGISVISTDIYELRLYVSKSLVSIVGSVEDFLCAIRTIQKYGWEKHKQKSQMRMAMDQSWEKKVQAIVRVL